MKAVGFTFVLLAFAFAAAAETGHLVRCQPPSTDLAKIRVQVLAAGDSDVIVATLACGERFEIVGRAYERGKDFVQIRTSQGKQGFVLASEVQSNNDSSPSASSSAVIRGETLARAARSLHQQYAGILVDWEQIDKPNRLAASVRGALLGAALTPPPSSEQPSGAGDGISRTAQGVAAASQAQQQMPYPTRGFTFYTFRSGYYVLRASTASKRQPTLSIGEVVQFRVKHRSLFLSDESGETFKLKLVEMDEVSTPYLPPSGAGLAFSPGQ